ncbi:MAG: hypothetical protein H7Y09_07400 [Chitinophagaceae bacterium]|nr:hypothetical protein [Anaerolineae bacterium]
MTKPVSKKMGIKEDARTIFVNAPAEAIAAIDLPRLDVASEFTGDFDYIHLFAKSQAEFREIFPKLKIHLKPTGTLWVSWPKNRQLGTNLSLTKIISMGYEYGLVESTVLSIDTTWSAIKFTHPKMGKVYHNSYGQLSE